jgi:hypothetical protein
MKQHIIRVIKAFINACKIVQKTRGMRCSDKVVRRFVDMFVGNEKLLPPEEFSALCVTFARYLMLNDDRAASDESSTLPPTMVAMVARMKPVIFISNVDEVRHSAIDYDVCMLAFCDDDTAPLAKHITRWSYEVEEKCDIVARARALEDVKGRLMLVHANEKNYDNVPAVAKAQHMRDKRILDRVSIEFFYAAELQFDRLSHRDVTCHVPLDVLMKARMGDVQCTLFRELARDTERGWLMARREPANLPKIQSDDIIVRMHGMVLGQIVRVENNDAQLGGTFFEYLQII